jgi:hypothetical protein
LAPDPWQILLRGASPAFLEVFAALELGEVQTVPSKREANEEECFEFIASSRVTVHDVPHIGSLSDPCTLQRLTSRLAEAAIPEPYSLRGQVRDAEVSNQGTAASLHQECASDIREVTPAELVVIDDLCTTQESEILLIEDEEVGIELSEDFDDPNEGISPTGFQEPPATGDLDPGHTNAPAATPFAEIGRPVLFLALRMFGEKEPRATEDVNTPRAEIAAPAVPSPDPPMARASDERLSPSDEESPSEEPLGTTVPDGTTKPRARWHRCAIPDCRVSLRVQTFCRVHGGQKQLRRPCANPGCTNASYLGPHCKAHGVPRCAIKDCGKPAKSCTQRLCLFHGLRRKISGCNRHGKRSGLCRSHGRCDLGSTEGCSTLAYRRGKCMLHLNDRCKFDRCFKAVVESDSAQTTPRRKSPI